MKEAIIEIHERLVKSGMSDEEADMLAGRFLFEEAFIYVECMKQVEAEVKKNTIIH